MRRTVLISIVLAIALAAPAAAFAAYGSIAVNPRTAAFGGAYNWHTKHQAERAALRHCRGDCRTLLWVRNYCGAAVLTRTKFWSGFGATHKAAIRDARRRAHNRHARVLTWVCSG